MGPNKKYITVLNVTKKSNFFVYNFVHFLFYKAQVYVWDLDSPSSYPHHGTTPRHSQCCGTILTDCGPGPNSFFGKVLVPVAAPVPDPDLISIVFNNKKFVQNYAFSMLEAALFARKLASNF
jgi:hypothetical protein